MLNEKEEKASTVSRFGIGLNDTTIWKHIVLSGYALVITGLQPAALRVTTSSCLHVI